MAEYQEFHGFLQQQEAASLEGARIELEERAQKERLAAELGVDQRYSSEFVQQMRAMAPTPEEAATALMTPAMLEAKVGGAQALGGGADVAEMKAQSLLGSYHAWNIKNSFPVPGSMLVDDYRRRFLSMYASSEERALLPLRRERELKAEVKVAVLDRFDEHRLPTAVEELLGKLEVLVAAKDEAAAAASARGATAPAGDADMEVFDMIQAKPPQLVDVEERFKSGLVSVGAVHPVTGATGLMQACNLGLLSVVRLYLGAGADASFGVAHGVTCLHCSWDSYARLAGRATSRPSAKALRRRFLTIREIITELLEYGADPNKSSANGITPLHMAASYGHDDICGLLLRHGADRFLRDFRGLTPYDCAVRENRQGARQLLANWEHIERQYKMEEWRMEWDAVLVNNAIAERVAARNAHRGANAAAGGAAGSGAAEARRRALEAMWGKPNDPKDPKRTAALSDTAAYLKARATQESLLRHRAAAAQAFTAEHGGDPRLTALATVKVAEYDMERDSLRRVDAVADAEAAGEAERLKRLRAVVQKVDVDAGVGLPWGMRPPKTELAGEVEHALALAEEDAAVREELDEGEQEYEAMRENAGLGEAELLLAKQARGAGGNRDRLRKARGRGGGSSSPGDRAVARESAARAGATVNVVREDEVAHRTEAMYGREGAGAYRPPALLAEIAELEAQEKATAAALEARVQEELANQRRGEEKRNELIQGKKVKGAGRWVKTKFGTMNFIADDDGQSADPVKKKKEELAEARKGVTAAYLNATFRQQRAGIGDKKLSEMEMEAAKKTEEKEKEDALDEDTKALLEYDRQKEYLQQWYIGEKRDPKSDGKVLLGRRRLVATGLRADAAPNLRGYTAILPLPHSEIPDEKAVMTRKPAVLSGLLRGSRIRVDNRQVINADMVVAEGTAFDSIITGENLLALPLPPSGKPARPPLEDRDDLSEEAAASLAGATPSVVARENAEETPAEKEVTAGIHLRTMRMLAGKGLTVPLRQGFGQLAANDVAVLPSASSKRIAAESAGFQPAGTTKTRIAAQARVKFAELTSALAGTGTATAVDTANVQRVRNTLARGVVDLGIDMQLANAARLEYNAELQGDVDYASKIPLGDERTSLDPNAKVKRSTLQQLERAKEERQAKAAERRKAEEDAAKHKMARAVGLEKGGGAPTYGASAVQAWPLHAPGPLHASTEHTGLLQGQPSGMLFRHFSVLDGVAASKRLEAAERLTHAKAAAEKLGQPLATVTAMLEKEARGAAKAGAGVQAAGKARAAALAAAEKARVSMTSMARMFMAGGDARQGAPSDRAIPVLTGAALETQDYLDRVRQKREYEIEVEEEKDLRGARDPRLAQHVGAADPWLRSKIDWRAPGGRFPAL